MQRRYSEPNSYIESAPPGPQLSDDLYDDVASIGADLEVRPPQEDAEGEHPLSEEQLPGRHLPQTRQSDSQVYLDLTPVRSFLHTGLAGLTESGTSAGGHSGGSDSGEHHHPRGQCGPQGPSSRAGGGPGSSSLPPLSPHPPRGRSMGGGDHVYRRPSAGGGVSRGGKNRTEADVRLYSEERDRLEKEREEVRSALASFKKERRETRGGATRLARSKTPSVAPTVATPPPPPSTNGSCGDPATPVNCATALKTRPAPMMAPSKVNVLRKAKEWEKKSSS
ncbi:hypothetical protein NHX12_025420 [Muraenolepis orangiensis]|uniref:Uncharacterized protein n=1 Tax=Muraenolepis orangiensis TaxID=630683 RepID=A0A9Q0EPS8_9TELE|nr:hypothetical protein NHX12_025420 [Muraenolepis orangiensis]